MPHLCRTLFISRWLVLPDLDEAVIASAGQHKLLLMTGRPGNTVDITSMRLCSCKIQIKRGRVTPHTAALALSEDADAVIPCACCNERWARATTTSNCTIAIAITFPIAIAIAIASASCVSPVHAVDRALVVAADGTDPLPPAETV
jgi:hypothetical protein